MTTTATQGQRRTSDDTPENRAKLPRWARFLIDRLEADLASYKKTAHAVLSGESPVFVDHYAAEPQYLDPKARVVFIVNGSRIEARIATTKVWSEHQRAYLPREVVRIYGESGALIVVPTSGNAVEIEARRR